jgi:hypothetical protein
MTPSIDDYRDAGFEFMECDIVFGQHFFESLVLGFSSIITPVPIMDRQYVFRLE